MQTNSDFRDLFAALNGVDAEYLVVGALALAAHGHVRATKDLDVWVEALPENAERVYRALAVFGVPLDDLTVKDLASSDLIFQIGVPPLRVDIITSTDGVGVEFVDARESVVGVRGSACSRTVAPPSHPEGCRSTQGFGRCRRLGRWRRLGWPRQELREPQAQRREKRHQQQHHREREDEVDIHAHHLGYGDVGNRAGRDEHRGHWRRLLPDG